MGRAVTLAQLRTDVEFRYDLPTSTTTTFITSSAFTRAANVSLQALYAMLMEAYGDSYFDAVSTLSVSSATTSLPTDCYKLRKLLWARGTNDIVPVRLGTADDLRLAHYSTEAWSAPRYALRQQTIVWLPPPNAACTVHCHYVQGPADLSGDSSSFQGGPGWDEWVVLDLCRKIAEREEKDTAPWVALRNDVERRIVAQAPERDESEGYAVRDVMGRSGTGVGTHALRDWITRFG